MRELFIALVLIGIGWLSTDLVLKLIRGNMEIDQSLQQDLNSHYSNNSGVMKNWKFARASVQGGYIDVHIQLPHRQYTKMLTTKSDVRRLVKNLCPDHNEQIWQKVPTFALFRIWLNSDKENSLEVVDCPSP